MTTCWLLTDLWDFVAISEASKLRMWPPLDSHGWFADIQDTDFCSMLRKHQGKLPASIALNYWNNSYWVLEPVDTAVPWCCSQCFGGRNKHWAIPITQSQHLHLRIGSCHHLDRFRLEGSYSAPMLMETGLQDVTLVCHNLQSGLHHVDHEFSGH